MESKMNVIELIIAEVENGDFDLNNDTLVYDSLDCEDCTIQVKLRIAVGVSCETKEYRDSPPESTYSLDCYSLEYVEVYDGEEEIKLTDEEKNTLDSSLSDVVESVVRGWDD